MLRKELIIHYLWWKFKANINQTIIKRKSTLIILFSLLMSIIINAQSLNDLKETYDPTGSISDQTERTLNNSHDTQNSHTESTDRETSSEREQKEWLQNREHPLRNKSENNSTVYIDTYKNEAYSTRDLMYSLLNSYDINAIQNALDAYLNLLPGQKSYMDTNLYLKLQSHLVLVKQNKIKALNYNRRLFSDSQGLSDKDFLDSYNKMDDEVKKQINKDLLDIRIREYKLAEKAKSLDDLIDNIFSNINDITLSRVGIKRILELKKELYNQGGLKYLKNNEKITLLEKKIEYEKIKPLSLTPENIRSIDENSILHNHADWKQIYKNINNSKRLITILGVLNTANEGILPEYIGFTEKSYVFATSRTTGDMKTTSLYYLSKDGQKISYIEDIRKFEVDLADMKGTTLEAGIFELNKDGVTAGKNILSSDLVNNNETSDKKKLLDIGLSIELLNTKASRQENTNYIEINENGSTIIGGQLATSIGWSSSVSISGGTNGFNGSTSINLAGVSGVWSPMTKPMMRINEDNSVNFIQRKYDFSVETGVKVSSGISFNKKGKDGNKEASISLPLISLKAAIETPDIDGALKQISPDVAMILIDDYLDDREYVVPALKYEYQKSTYPIVETDAKKTQDNIFALKEELNKYMKPI